MKNNLPKEWLDRLNLADLQNYRDILSDKLDDVNSAITNVKGVKINLPKLKSPIIEIKKEEPIQEDKIMCNLGKVMTALAVVSAVLGAVAYFLYKKNQHLNQLEDMLYGNEFDSEYLTDDEIEAIMESDAKIEDITTPVETADDEISF